MILSRRHSVKLAIGGVLLPFLVDALLIILFRQQIGHANYPSDSFTRATDMIIAIGWITLTVVPFFCFLTAGQSRLNSVLLGFLVRSRCWFV